MPEMIRHRKVDVRVYGPRDDPPEEINVVNVTSKSKESWSRTLSPFHLGPVRLYGDVVAKKMENAWQFAKVYRQHVDDEGQPTQAYWDWAMAGWEDDWAHRYPMGKGAVPLYSLWDGERLSYVEARKRIYVPLYARCVRKTGAWKLLQSLCLTEKVVGMWDYDGYDHVKLKMNLKDVLNCETRKMGHAFVLAMMLKGECDA